MEQHGTIGQTARTVVQVNNTLATIKNDPSTGVGMSMAIGDAQSAGVRMPMAIGDAMSTITVGSDNGVDKMVKHICRHNWLAMKITYNWIPTNGDTTPEHARKELVILGKDNESDEAVAALIEDINTIKYATVTVAQSRVCQLIIAHAQRDQEPDSTDFQRCRYLVGITDGGGGPGKYGPNVLDSGSTIR
jgi:hypothetical protein